MSIASLSFHLNGETTTAAAAFARHYKIRLKQRSKEMKAMEGGTRKKKRGKKEKRETQTESPRRSCYNKKNRIVVVVVVVAAQTSSSFRSNSLTVSLSLAIKFVFPIDWTPVSMSWRGWRGEKKEKSRMKGIVWSFFLLFLPPLKRASRMDGWGRLY